MFVAGGFILKIKCAILQPLSQSIYTYGVVAWRCFSCSSSTDTIFCTSFWGTHWVNQQEREGGRRKAKGSRPY